MLLTEFLLKKNQWKAEQPLQDMTLQEQEIQKD